MSESNTFLCYLLISLLISWSNTTYMYTRQCMCTTWNGVKSEFFATENGVKQGGILSPILFCVYIDELLNRLLSSGIGCHMGHLSYACFGYADDVNLLAPSVGALQDLIIICEKIAKEYHFIFNEKKVFVCVSGVGWGGGW